MFRDAPSLAPATDLPVGIPIWAFPEAPAKAGRMGSRPSRAQFKVQQPSLLPGLPGPIHTLAIHQDSHGHLHQPTTPRPVSKAKRSWMLLGEVCFLEECSKAGRFWGLERKTDSNTLMASSANSKNPLPAMPRAYCSPANPKGKGLSSRRHETQTTGLSSRLQETLPPQVGDQRLWDPGTSPRQPSPPS